MSTILLFFVIAFVGVQSQNKIMADYGRTIYKQNPINNSPPELYTLPTVPSRYEEAVAINNPAVPNASTPKMPVVPFVTELPSCPDVSFSDILKSPLGCLDPILNVYSTAKIVEMPVNPVLPPASSPLASPFSNSFTPVSPSDRDTHFLTRVPIPPTFI